MGKLFWLRTVIVVLILTIGTVVANAFEPVVSSGVAVGQLKDTYSSNANMTIYSTFRNYAWLIYPIVIALAFIPEIKKAFTK